MGDSYGGGIVVDVNYAKDEVIIAYSEDNVAIYSGENIFVFAEQEVATFNNDEEGGHSDWMLPSLFDAKRITSAYDGNTTYWTSDEFDNDEQKTVLFDGSKAIAGKELKSTTQYYVVIRKQVVTA